MFYHVIFVYFIMVKVTIDVIAVSDCGLCNLGAH